MHSLIELSVAVNEKEKASTDVSPMVQKALEKHREEREEAASNDIVALLRKIEARQTGNRQEVRRLKAQLRKAKSNMDDLDRRWAYAQSTNNFLPVLEFFGEVSPHDLSNPQDFQELTSVPSDFKVADF